LQRGHLDRTEWLWIAVIAILAATALIAWVVLFAPDLSRLRSMLPAWSLLGLVAAGAGFSVLNALLEEVVWRGVLQAWLLTWVPPWAAVGAQALSFGAAHYAGFPAASSAWVWPRCGVR
jgi:membrane protease YdiL (CAAX protease family)